MDSKTVDQISDTTTVSEIVLKYPLASGVFLQAGINFCCGGKVPLHEACAEKGLNTEEIIQRIETAISEAEPSKVNSESSPAEIIDEILTRFHEPLADDLEHVLFFAEKVARVHGERHPHLLQVYSTYQNVYAELKQHMMKEERILFPMIRALQSAKEKEESFEAHCGSVQNPIRQMEFEHDNALTDFETIQKLTDDYAPPADACNSYRALYAGLKKMHEDLIAHINLENNFLHPAALALES